MLQFYHSASILGTELSKIRTLTLIIDGKAVWFKYLS